MKPTAIAWRPRDLSSDGHFAPMVQLAGDGLFPRCTRCGHRQRDITGTRPVPTRSLPLSTWLAELRARRIARRAAP